MKHSGIWAVILHSPEESALIVAPDQGGCWPHAMELACQAVTLNPGARATVFKIPNDLVTVAMQLGYMIENDGEPW